MHILHPLLFEWQLVHVHCTVVTNNRLIILEEIKVVELVAGVLYLMRADRHLP